MSSGVKHPAKFNDPILAAISDALDGRVPRGGLLLDPMAGVGRCHRLPHKHGWRIIGGELELPWAREGLVVEGGPMVASDARSLPFADRVFDGFFMSPDYGNRMADHHNAKDPSTRHTYTHYARGQGWELRPETTCKDHWGREYWKGHRAIMVEVARVVKLNGWGVVNVKNFRRTRKGVSEVVQVVPWYEKMLGSIGFEVVRIEWVAARGLRHGENGDARETHEALLIVTVPPF